MDVVPPVVGVVKEFAFAHGAAGYIDVLPVQTEHILAAKLLPGGGNGFKDKSPGHVIGNHGGAEKAGFGAVQNPKCLFVDKCTLYQLSGADGVVEHGNSAAAKSGDLGYNFHFFFTEGDFHCGHSFYRFIYWGSLPCCLYCSTRAAEKIRSKGTLVEEKK